MVVFPNVCERRSYIFMVRIVGDFILIFWNMTELVYGMIVFNFFSTVVVVIVVYDFGRMFRFIFADSCRNSLLLYCIIGIFLSLFFLNIVGSLFAILSFSSISLSIYWVWNGMLDCVGIVLLFLVMIVSNFFSIDSFRIFWFWILFFEIVVGIVILLLLSLILVPVWK